MGFPDFSFEKKLWEKRFRLVIGVDEVGRGAFAGPVVAGAAAVKSNSETVLEQIRSLGINDSKKLSGKRRNELDQEIRMKFRTGIGLADNGFINKFGIKAATEKAMRAAVVDLLYKVSDSEGRITGRAALPVSKIRELKPYLLIDAFNVKYIPVVGLSNQLAIVKGDSKSVSIAAASIIAKVYRDSMMKKLHLEFPSYFWDENAGYGTAKHIEALQKYSYCKYHRVKYISNIRA